MLNWIKLSLMLVIVGIGEGLLGIYTYLSNLLFEIFIKAE